jgi:putative ABC transport system substrate-binding protein
MNRRDLLVLAGLAAAPRAIRAKKQAKPAKQARLPVVGVLNPGFPNLAESSLGLVDGLRELGFVDGATVRIENRWGLGKPELLPAFAEELVRLKVDVILAVARTAINAARLATTILPIVAIDLESDPVAAGFIDSFKAPRGNITGLFLDQPELTGKWLQLIREIVPGARRVAVLWDANTSEDQLRAILAAAKAIQVNIQLIKFRNAAEMDGALSAGLQEQPNALVQLSSPLIIQLADHIASIVAGYRIPAISMIAQFPENGGLMSYGPDLPFWSRRLVRQIAAILKGAKPTDIPAEMPINFELVVNLKTATALGISIPSGILTVADRVID